MLAPLKQDRKVSRYVDRQLYRITLELTQVIDSMY